MVCVWRRRRVGGHEEEARISSKQTCAWALGLCWRSGKNGCSKRERRPQDEDGSEAACRQEGSGCNHSPSVRQRLLASPAGPGSRARPCHIEGRSQSDTISTCLWGFSDGAVASRAPENVRKREGNSSFWNPELLMETRGKKAQSGIQTSQSGQPSRTPTISTCPWRFSDGFVGAVPPESVRDSSPGRGVVPSPFTCKRGNSGIT